MADSGRQPSFACKCLNVRIHAQPPPSSPPEARDEHFRAVHVGNDGVKIAHTQLTLRNKGSSFQRTTGLATESMRTVSLTCLVCKTLVYRITQAVVPGTESGEGMVLPTEDWVENEVLRSASGWIEVSKDILTEQGIQEAESAPGFSKTFNIVLPSGEFIPPKVEESLLSPPQTPRNNSPTLPEEILPHLPDLFPPPPFTPAHPVYQHLSSIAAAESQKLRADAEEHLRSLFKAKIAELQAAEANLKHNVDNIWYNFKGVVEKLEEEEEAAPGQLRLRNRASGSRSRHAPTASVRVTDFVPAPSPPPRNHVTPSAPAQSALSASLASSNLQDAMARRGRTGSPADPTSPSRTARTDSPSTASFRTLGIAINGQADIREALRRNMDESVDMATSFKYMMDLEAEMEGMRKPTLGDVAEEEEPVNDIPSPITNAAPRGRSPRAGASKSAIKKPKTNGDSGPVKEQGTPPAQTAAQDNGAPNVGGTPKGKRKVTFDVKENVKVIADANSNERSPSQTVRPEEEVFDFESESLGDNTDVVGTMFQLPETEMPVQETIHLARRPQRHFRSSSNSALPAELASLRPASLPAPSTMRRTPRPLEPLDERARVQSVRDSVLSPTDPEGKRRDVGDQPTELADEVEEITDPREAEILRLVAASMPSHRSAWKRDGAAWNTFVNRQKSKDYSRPAIAEEDEGSAAESSAAEGSAYYDESGESGDSSEPDESRDWGNNTVAKSLPIPIGPLGRNGTATWQPKASLNGKVSAAAMRRASYAERDRMRSIDPGALDFVIDEEELEEMDKLPLENNQVGGKSMQRALNILQKQSEIPGAGMWRSLA